ncbi:DUF2336 domain-containing protein [Magnetovibrio sp.]|uniref:DUF2336 domain-containing protein n=1 Tax=Magnetovibrio sp. TaxID=2024836 RepID=UPI002F955CF3
MLKGLLEKFRKGKTLDYEEAKELARNEDVKVRQEVAEHPNAQPEILYFLATDKVASVRAAIADNSATPRQADVLLTKDEDEGVRSRLAAKISKLAPGLSANEVDKLRRMTYEALETLARDQATKVRQIVAETLKDMADAPPEVIRHLAEDSELMVCAPVLENSPVLTEYDLQQIINLNPVEGALSAISRRSNLTDEVMEKIFAANDTAAVAELLGNGSVSIKEDLLERICDRSRTVKSLQDPLVHRPTLPKSVALRLADFVADHLIKALLNRKDLDPETAKAVREEVSWRLDLAAEEEATAGQETAYAKAKRLHAEGNLVPDMVDSALKAGQKEYAIAALAVLGEMTPGTVEQIARSNNPKAIVALSWKAGLQPESILLMQKRLGAITPSKVIKTEGGLYPLTEDEMEWLLEFFGN